MSTYEISIVPSGINDFKIMKNDIKIGLYRLNLNGTPSHPAYYLCYHDGAQLMLRRPQIEVIMGSGNALHSTLSVEARILTPVLVEPAHMLEVAERAFVRGAIGEDVDPIAIMVEWLQVSRREAASLALDPFAKQEDRNFVHCYRRIKERLQKARSRMGANKSKAVEAQSVAISERMPLIAVDQPASIDPPQPAPIAVRAATPHLAEALKAQESLTRHWRRMMAACYELDHSYFDQFGGRGVTVEPEWHELGNFCQDIIASGEQFVHRTLRPLDITKPLGPKNFIFTAAKGRTRIARKLTDDDIRNIRDSRHSVYELARHYRTSKKIIDAIRLSIRHADVK